MGTLRFAHPTRFCYHWRITVGLSYEHPVVLPHVSHFMHVPFLTKVKFPHSPQASPSYPRAFASARLPAASARASARGSGLAQGRRFELLGGGELLLGLGLQCGRAGDFAARAVAGERGYFRPAAATPAGFAGGRTPAFPRERGGRRGAAAHSPPPGITTSLSVRERVSPFET